MVTYFCFSKISVFGGVFWGVFTPFSPWNNFAKAKPPLYDVITQYVTNFALAKLYFVGSSTLGKLSWSKSSTVRLALSVRSQFLRM